MRSKEVEEAIDTLQNCIADDVISYYCTRNKKRLCDTSCEKKNEDCIYNQAIDKVVAYISELEKDVKDAMEGYQDLGKDLAFNFISKEDIRAKIKELEEEGLSSGIIKTIQVLKELLEN